MNATPVIQPDREAIRILVQSVGYSEAATRTGLKRDRLYKWGQRYGWKSPVTHAQGNVQTVQSPADSHAEALADLEGETRMSLARYARNAAGAVHKSVHPAKWTKQAHEISKTMAVVHRQGDKERDQQQVAVNIAILNA